MTQATTNIGRGRSCGEADRFSGLNEFGCRKSNTALFGSESLFARQKRTVITKRLVEKRLDKCCAPVGATDETPVFQSCQIATDARRRRTGDGENLFDGRRSEERRVGKECRSRWS